MNIRYITIEREYGSGGTAIARRVSQETGIPCYGVEILEAVAKKYGRSVDAIEHLEETAAGSLMYSLYAFSQVSTANPNLLTGEGQLYVAEQEIITRLAHNGPAIFLGHCASEALKEQTGVIRVFIRCTDAAQKRARIANEYKIPEADIESTRKRFDKKRANYYNSNMSQRWDDLRNYDLILDSAALGTDACVNVLKACLL